MKRRIIGTQFSLLTLLLIAFSGDSWAQEKCIPVTEEMKTRLAQYVQKKFAGMLPPNASVGVTEVTPVEGTCYRKLHFSARDAQRPIEFDLYLSPDGRFLARDLADSHLDPIDEERRRTDRLRVELVKGTFPSAGPKGGPITVVIFSDFQCPFCKNAADIVKQVVSEDKNVRVVFRHLPLRIHPWARAAAEATACAGMQSDAVFWNLHDMIFENQRSLTIENVHTKVLEYGQLVPGLEMVKYQKCLTDRASAPLVQADERFAAAHAIDGTPTLFVNGHRVQGVRSPEQLRATIRERLNTTEGKPKTASR